MNTAVPITVDRASPVPLYFQVAARLEQAIESGQLTPGMRLDNETDLADQLGVSRPTMRRAIQYLVDRGLLVRQRGIGTRVIGTKVRRPVELTSLYDHLASTGRQPRTTVLSLTIEPASDATAHTLGIAEGAAVYTLERLRLAGDEPLALMRDQVPTTVVELDRDSLEERGLYEILRANNVVPKIANQTIGARHSRRSTRSPRKPWRPATHHATHRLRRPRPSRRTREACLPCVVVQLRAHPDQQVSEA